MYGIRIHRLLWPVALAWLSGCANAPVDPSAGAPPERPAGWRSMGEVLAATTQADWRTIAPDNLLYVTLPGGTVVIELAPQFAPAHVANLRRLVAAGHFAPARIVRSQDNYVAQWSGGGPTGDAALALAPEFYRDRAGLDLRMLDSADAYAPQVGFVDGFPAASDGRRAWLTHCYGMVGAGRDVAPDSGNAAELYVVTGHAPRHLDRNVTLLGRVIAGMPALSTLPRGTGPLGFYEREEDYVPITAVRIGAEEPRWQALRTDSPAFDALVTARRYRYEEWFADPAGAVGVCNVPLPVRSD